MISAERRVSTTPTIGSTSTLSQISMTGVDSWLIRSILRCSSPDSEYSVCSSASIHAVARWSQAAGGRISNSQRSAPQPMHLVSIATTGWPKNAEHQPLA